MDNALLSTWASEDLAFDGDEPLAGECNFFNFSRAYTAGFCDPFSVSRMQASTVRAAADRALRCAAKHAVECVLSAEVGFAVPAAFVSRHDGSGGMHAIVAPRMLQLPRASTSSNYVRVAAPDGASFSSTTLQFNDSVKVEYVTTSKKVETTILTGSDAFCLQLLRVAFHSDCWKQLDGA